MGLEVIILAAGQGTRMQSDLPKVLHAVAGKPMMAHVLETAKKLAPEKVHVVIGHAGEQIKNHFSDHAINWCVQEEQLGTGHAVQQAMPNINAQQNILILYADVPLLSESSLQLLTKQLTKKDIVLLSAIVDDPTGYGRIVRDSNKIQRIVEEKDADESTQKIKEINTGILACNAEVLEKCLSHLTSDNAQGEFYLTDCIEIGVSLGHSVEAIVCEDFEEVSGINNKQQLAQIERTYQLRVAKQLMQQGVTLMDPARFDVRGSLNVGKDVEIDVNALFIGDNTLGDNVKIGSNAVIINSTINSSTRIHANCHIENAIIGNNCELGPFARIRPDTILDENIKVGNFVEIKKSKIKSNSKINHLSYIGDSELGKNVNIGAGTITCNYDGANKHSTIIGDDVFVGSDTQFVAPVSIADGSTIGAGSTITKNTPKDKLTLSRSKQVTMNNWQRPKKHS